MWENFWSIWLQNMGMLDYWVNIPYLAGNACQQKGITMICFSVKSFLHTRHVLTMLKKIGNYLLCGAHHSM